MGPLAALRSVLERLAPAAPVLFLAGAGHADPASRNPILDPGNAWAVALFGGPLTENVFATSLYSPGRFANSGLAGVDVTYTYFSLPTFPLKLELDVTAAKRFGQDDAWEFGFVPTFRWTSFPWNDFLYTNVRVGPVGVNYATDVSAWELHWAGNNHGSRWLNYFLVEIDVRPSERSPIEFFGGWSHRSGAWGLWNGAYGGSTYEVLGVRYHF